MELGVAAAQSIKIHRQQPLIAAPCDPACSHTIGYMPAPGTAAGARDAVQASKVASTQDARCNAHQRLHGGDCSRRRDAHAYYSLE